MSELDRMKGVLIRLYNVPDLMFVVAGEDSVLAEDFEALIEEIAK